VEGRRLLRLGAVAAVLGGCAIAGYNVVEYVFFSGAPMSSLANLPGWLAFQIVGLLGTLFVVLGLCGLYAAQAQHAGVLGLVGFTLALVGVLQYYGLTFMAAFLLPSVGRAAPMLLDGPDPLLGAGLIGTVLISTLGWILFAVATLRTRVFPRWTGVLLLVAAIVPFVTMPVGIALPVGPVALGIALIGMGYSMLTGRADPRLLLAPA